MCPIEMNRAARIWFNSFLWISFQFFRGIIPFRVCVCFELRWVELRAANILRVIQMRPEDLIPYYSMIHASQFALGLFIQRSERCSSL